MAGVVCLCCVDRETTVQGGARKKEGRKRHQAGRVLHLPERAEPLTSRAHGGEGAVRWQRERRETLAEEEES